MSRKPVKFQIRESIEQVEEGDDLAPRFDDRGLITVVTTDADSGELLMQGYMNAEGPGQNHRDGRGSLLQPQPAGPVAQGRDQRFRSARARVARR